LTFAVTGEALCCVGSCVCLRQIWLLIQKLDVKCW